MSENEFRKMLGESLMATYKQILEDADDSHIFSDRFEHKMEKLIGRRKKSYYKLINTLGKRVACIALAVVIAASTTVLSVASLRGPIFKFFIRMFSDHSNISTESNERSAYPKTIEDRYEITYGITDYTIINEFSSNEELTIHYQKKDEYIYYTQHIIDDHNVNYNTEDTQIENFQINGYDAVGYLDNHGWYSIIWDNGEYIFSLGSNVGKDALIQIAESVEKIE